MKRFILLSFDVEEFDTPLEYHHPIDLDEQLEIGYKGTKEIALLLNQHNITSTLFTTANYAEHFSDQIKELSAHHEIASHTFYHSSFKNEDLLTSRLKLEEICGKKITGLRMPRMRKVEMVEVYKAGYQYDSSVHPTFIPGRYNNLHLPRTSYMEDGVKRLPASVSPNLRIPLFWLSFKNFPYHLFKTIALNTLRKDGYICLYFHPWEFTDHSKFKMPAFVKRHSGEALLNRLNKLIKDLKNEAEFITIHSFLQQ